MWCLAAAVIGCAVLIYLTLVDIENEKKLATIRAAVEDYAAHIKSLEGRYEMAFTPIGQFAGADESMTVDFAADLSGDRMIHDEYRVEASPKSPEISRRTRRIDADTALLTFTPRDGPEKAGWGEPHILVTRQRGRSGRTTPWHLAGLASPSTPVKGGLAQLWSLVTENWGGDAIYEGEQQMNGALCERVTIRYPDRRVRLWLDPAHDYLPRRQEFIDLPAGKSPKTTTDVIDTFEFAKYHDADADVMRWFPSRGKHQWYNVSAEEYEVEQLTINPSLDDKRFRIDIASLPDGVQINDNSPAPAVVFPNTSGGTVRYTGDRRDLWEAREQARIESLKEAALKGLFPQLPSAGTANLDEAGIYRDALSRVPWWAYAIVAAGAASLIALLIARVRRRRPRGAGF
jgi:hypothetical protein